MRRPSQGRLEASHRRTGTVVRVIAWTAMALLSSAPLQAQTVLPQGGSVVSGQARINAASNALTINQTTSRAIVDWNSFSVGQSGSVSFIQPSASSAILNRVTGSTSSTLAGSIDANGQVFLVNPNGIAITPSGTVQVGGGFVGSTLDIGNADFNAGHLNFTGNGASAAVSNAGTITSAPGGFVGLIGGAVSNSGTIRVPLGKVGLGSGEQVTLDPTGDGFLQVAVPTTAVAADGKALVDVSGRIRAAGGSIAISAATAQQAVRDAVHVSGALSARSVSGRSGNIVLDGGAGGNVSLSGKLSATGGTQAQGGSITVTGDTIALRGALVDVSGGTGGGTVLIGGGPHGSGPLPHAATTSVDSASLIKADATVSGNGGNVTVWSDQLTSFAGHISAQGGAQGGNGGQAEVSGEAQLRLTGDYNSTPLADLTAQRGKTGTLLFDPGTVNIVNQSTLDANSALNGPDTFTAQFISTQLNSANFSINTNNATGANGNAGDINLLAGAQITWSNNNILALQAAHNINFAAGSSIIGTGNGALLELRSGYAATGTGTVNFSGANQVSLTSGEVDIYYNPASNLVGGSNSNAGTAVNATSYTGAPASENWSSFVTAGTTILPLMLVNNVYDLQNINNNLAGNYALSRSIDANATSGWNAGAGFLPIGTNSAGAIQGAGYSGKFYGLNQTIDGLTINRGSANNVGLFGATFGASIDQTGLTNLSVVGATNVGGLIGSSTGTTAARTSVSQSFTAGGVTGNTNVGGLVGVTDNFSGIEQSYSTSLVHPSGNYAGGLVGSNSGTIVNSYATGTVTASGQGIGGLVGYNRGVGDISQSYASGAVQGNSYVGGLVGWNDGGVTQSYAIGAVTGNAGSYDVGGLVGLNNGSITTTWSSGASSGTFDSGGLVGLNNNSVSASYYDQNTSGQANGVGSGSATGVTGLTTAEAFTQGSYAGWDFTNVWWMDGTATRPFLRSEYSTNIVNAHQLQLVNLSNATLGANYTLAANIDGSVTNGGMFAAGMWTSSGFVPLGTDGLGGAQNGGNGFSGSFDGAGRIISSLTIDRGSANDIGLFGYVSSSASIRNIGLINTSVTGQNYVGGLVGENDGGAIATSYAAGAVSGNDYVGGLVGQNDLNASIHNAYATAAVTAAGADTGGLIGNNSGNGSIVSSYATGATSGAVAADTGGLAGLNGATATIVQSYYDPQATGQSNGIGLNSNAGGASVTGLTTTTFQNGSLPAGLGAAAWTAANGAYPALYWQTGTASPAVTTTVVIRATDANSGTSTYGQAPPTLSYTVTDGNGNILCTSNCAAYFSGTPLIDSTVSTTTPAGTVPGYVALGTLLAQAGYSFKFINDIIVVNPASITVTAQGGSSTYGSSPSNPGLSALGLKNGQSVNVLTGLSNSFGITGASNAGNYTLGVTGTLTNPNYTVAGTTSGSWIVNPAPVSVIALSGSSIYGSSPANPGLAATGLQNGQNVSALTGLRNSFDITSTSSTGSYILEVAGTLTNPNYTVAGTSNGSWIVHAATVLRGSQPAIPGLFDKGPSSNAGAGVLKALDGLSALSTGPAGPAAPRAPSTARTPAPAAPIPAAAAAPPPAGPIPQRFDIPRADPSPPIAPSSGPVAQAGCPDGKAGCDLVVPNQPAGLLDFVLSKLNRAAFAGELDRGLAEVRQSGSLTGAILTTVTAATSLSITIGVMGWLERSGALLSALLTSMPVLRGFDPLVVFVRTRRDEADGAPASAVERIFDNARLDRPTAKAASVIASGLF